VVAHSFDDKSKGKLNFVLYEFHIMCTVIENWWIGCCVQSSWVFDMNWMRVLVLLLLFMTRPCVLGIQTCLKFVLMV